MKLGAAGGCCRLPWFLQLIPCVGLEWPEDWGHSTGGTVSTCRSPPIPSPCAPLPPLLLESASLPNAGQGSHRPERGPICSPRGVISHVVTCLGPWPCFQRQHRWCRPMSIQRSIPWLTSQILIHLIMLLYFWRLFEFGPVLPSPSFSQNAVSHAYHVRFPLFLQKASSSLILIPSGLFLITASIHAVSVFSLFIAVLDLP